MKLLRKKRKFKIAMLVLEYREYPIRLKIGKKVKSSFKKLISLILMVIVLVGVMFVFLIFIEHLMQNI